MLPFNENWSVVYSGGEFYAIDDLNRIVYSFNLGDNNVPEEAMNAATRIEWFYSPDNIIERSLVRHGSYHSACS